MKNFLFLLRSYPDIDHIVPLIYKCLEEGDHAYLLFDLPYNYEKDYRLQFLSKYPNLTILHLWGVESSARWKRILSRFLMTDRSIGRLLKKYEIAAFFCEWGWGIDQKREGSLLAQMKWSWMDGVFQKKAKISGNFFPLLILKNLVRYRLNTITLRIRLIRMAKKVKIPIFALPHGVYTKLNLDYSPRIRNALREYNGKVPRADLNIFDFFIFTSEFHRQLYLKHSPLHAEITQTWGSLRFCPEWTEIMRKICPRASLPERNGAVRLLFFLPKWFNFVDRDSTLNLISSLAERRDIQLILKAHPRPEVGGLDENFKERILRSPNVFMAGSDHSAALVMDSDVILDIGTGMAIDALVHKKHLIYPAYLHENKLIFDELRGCLIANSELEVHHFLDQILKGQIAAREKEIQDVLEAIIYGGQKPFDVPSYYYQKIQDLVA